MKRRSIHRVALLAVAIAAASCQAEQAASPGELGDATLTRSLGVRGVERLTDGRVPATGGAWNSNRTVVFAGPAAFVEYDLGSLQPLEAVALMADNNDTYVVSGSADGERFSELWTAPRTPGRGLQWRSTRLSGASARFVRLHPGRGDAALSVAEFAVFTSPPSELPPRLEIVEVDDPALRLRSAMLHAALWLLLAAVFATRQAPRAFNVAVLGAAVGTSSYAVALLVRGAPVEPATVSLVRGLAAGVALVVVLRAAYASERFAPIRAVHTVILGVLAAVSVGAFYNLGSPQFHDHARNEPSAVHNFDMRVYFPVVKYFDELRYDGVYLASVAAFAEEHGGIASPAIQRVELRDLRDHRMRTVAEIADQVEGVRTRFSDARWAEFKRDMQYFWETMGPAAYLSSMSDHGGNATPVWLAFASLLFADAPASNETLLWGAALDPLLLLLFAAVVWRTFGLRTSLVCLIVFGANDFYMFGSNWAGATLRNDWMVYLGLGACAFATERYRLGGALLALSASIRAFPAIALIALAVPVLHELVCERRERGRFPNWRDFAARQRWFVDTAIGATACIAVLVIASSLAMGFEAWPLWIAKISSFTDSPHVNHVSWLSVVAGSESNQATVLGQRWLVYLAGIALYLGMAIWAAARSAPHRVALLGLSLMPVVMYPANYYLHFVFLLPLLVADRPSQPGCDAARESAGKVWAILLGLCAAQFFTVRGTDLSAHFYNASVLWMAALFALLFVLLPRDTRGRVDLDALPFLHR